MDKARAVGETELASQLAPQVTNATSNSRGGGIAANAS